MESSASSLDEASSTSLDESPSGTESTRPGGTPARRGSGVRSGRVSGVSSADERRKSRVEKLKKKSDTSFNLRFDEEIAGLNPYDMEDWEIDEWTQLLDKQNSKLKTEVWLLEKTWMKSRHMETSAEKGDQEKLPTQLQKKSSLEEYEEMKKGGLKGKQATFMQFKEANQIEKLPSLRSVSSLSLRSSPARSSDARKSMETTKSESSKIPLKLSFDDKLEIATIQLRQSKDERKKRRKRQENYLQNFKNEMEQHREHSKEIRRNNQIFKRETTRNLGKKSGKFGDVVIKCYDDILREKNHRLELIRLSTINLKKSERTVVENTKLHEEMGDNFTTVDYQKLQLENRTIERKHREVVHEICDLKKLLGECHFQLNRGRKSLEMAEAENKRIRREMIGTKSHIVMLEADTGDAIAAAATAVNENQELVNLLMDYIPPKVLEYVEEVDKVRQLKVDVDAMDRSVQMEAFALKQLQAALAKEKGK